MDNILEITGSHVAELTDADLRILIRRLCEEDYRSHGLPTSGIRGSGHQDAPDGGIDVIVNTEATPPKNSYIPCSETIFQIKKSVMPPSKIKKEMIIKDKGKEQLKPAIADLIDKNGAYIIVSSGDSVTEARLDKRIDKMKEVISQINDNQIHVDFFDQERVATWVRNHPSVILWIRNKIGKSLQGWKPYDNWVNAPEGTNEHYIQGPELRLYNINTNYEGVGINITDGLVELRKKFLNTRAAVRLTGESGVGKTHFIQALFNHNNNQPKITGNIFYTDISDNPYPNPTTFAENLIANKIKKGVLIVDNCPPDLHRKLNKICSSDDSNLSLLTVEYDIKDDKPEETEVFQLRRADSDIIERIIEKRFTDISRVNARTIAELSGGNARIAIMLAADTKEGETLSSFRDQELFDRLVHQQDRLNDSCLNSAKVCSLIYSFDAENEDINESELSFLAGLIGSTIDQLSLDVNKLKKRGLIQGRGKWRAVLPTALANRWAREALELRSGNTLLQKFHDSRLERLRQSFSRRLRYLHNCEEAKKIANTWIDNVNLKVGEVTLFEIEIFKNLATIVPEKSLNIIESLNFTNNSENNCFLYQVKAEHLRALAMLIYKLAYEERFFKKCVVLLSNFVLNQNCQTVRDQLKRLFYVSISGTHASPRTRADVINTLAESSNLLRQDLGFLLLSSSLKVINFPGIYDYDFGAQLRDHGYHPRNQEEIFQWYSIFIELCEKLALSSDDNLSDKARKILSDRLNELWKLQTIRSILKETIIKIHEKRPWASAWIAIKSISNNPDHEEQSNEYLKELEEKLDSSKNLIEKVKIFILTDSYTIVKAIGKRFSTYNERVEEINNTAHDLGVEVSTNPKALENLAMHLMTCSGNTPALENFGVGLSEGCNNKEEYWNDLSKKFNVSGKTITYLSSESNLPS